MGRAPPRKIPSPSVPPWKPGRPKGLRGPPRVRPVSFGGATRRPGGPQGRPLLVFCPEISLPPGVISPPRGPGPGKLPLFPRPQPPGRWGRPLPGPRGFPKFFPQSPLWGRAPLPSPQRGPRPNPKPGGFPGGKPRARGPWPNGPPKGKSPVGGPNNPGSPKSQAPEGGPKPKGPLPSPPFGGNARPGIGKPNPNSAPTGGDPEKNPGPGARLSPKAPALAFRQRFLPSAPPSSSPRSLGV